MSAPVDEQRTMAAPTEPTIVVNGVALTRHQAMTVRVALSDFLMDLADPEHLDALGPIGPVYQRNGNEVLALMVDTKCADPACTGRHVRGASGEITGHVAVKAGG